MTKKITKREYFAQIKEVIKGNVELENFIDHEVELLDRKSTSKAPTKTQKENEVILNTIVETLKELDKAVTITDLQKANTELEVLSNQKVSALLKKLVDNGSVERIVDKKVTYFKVVA